MKYMFVILFSLLCFNCQSQKSHNFNFDFESNIVRNQIPKEWTQWGDYTSELDSLNSNSGKFSAKIFSNEKVDSYGSVTYKIPAKYEGKMIQLNGYMKINKIENGFGGLILRIDGDGENLAYDNMESQKIQQTNGWQKFSISLRYPENAEIIYIGGIMTGQGEAWFDDFELTIDGNDIQFLKMVEDPIFPASLDKEFDLNSNVKFPEITNEIVENLDLLGKVWGFLKYYHPKVGKGNFNWDYELFRILPKYLKVSNNLDRDEALADWIDKYGKIEECASCKKASDDSFLKPDFSWFSDFNLQPRLKEKLKYIYNNRYQGKHYYVKQTMIGNPIFLNENKYYSMSYDDGGFKLLSLYRFWNMVNYFYPYKYLTDTTWSNVLKTNISNFILSNNKFEYELACIQLIGQINDTHSTSSVGFNNIQKIRGNFFPAFKVEFMEKKLVVIDYYNPEFKTDSKLQIGDVITHINGKSIESIIDSLKSYYPASNSTAQLRDISKDILRSNRANIDIKFTREKLELQYNIPLFDENDLNMRWYNWTNEKSYKMLSDNIGYVNLKNIKKEDISIIKKNFKGTKGIIIDIRNYPSEFVPFSLGSFFVSSSTPFVKFTKFNKYNYGEFNFTKPVEISAGDETYKGRLVVLVNENSQSQSEYTAMAFRAGNDTTIIGSETAGTDGNVSVIYLPGGLLTNFSGVGIYYPDGKETQRIGIIPDIKIKQTILGVKKGKDEILERAIDFLNQ